jgi:hypothetical protein
MKRRQFLAGMGLTAGSLFLPSIGTGRRAGAAASTDAPPQRLLIFYTRHGVWGDAWKMNSENLNSNVAWTSDLSMLAEEEFSVALRPLHPFRDRLSLIDGMSLLSAEADITGQRHEIGQVHSLTGSNVELLGGVPLASSLSIDQHIAKMIARDDGFRSLELAVGSPENSVVYGGPLHVLPYESNGNTVFSRLFGSAGNGENLSSVGQLSMLDRVADRYSALESQLGVSDREKLAVHQQLIREIELRLERLSTLSCDTSSFSIPTGEEAYNENLEVMSQLISSAFSCDLTRVVSLNMDEIPIEDLVPNHGGDLHFDFAHNAFVDQQAADVMSEYSRKHAEQFATILSQLDSVPEGGGTLLDNTLCVWVSELGDPAHGYDRYNAVLAGGNAIQHGRYHHFPSELEIDAWSWDGGISTMGRPHQQLLTTICRAMGLQDDSFGLKEARGKYGQIDLTGWLTNLI